VLCSECIDFFSSHIECGQEHGAKLMYQRDNCSLIKNIQLVLPLLWSQVFDGFVHGVPCIRIVTVGAAWVEIWFLHISKHQNSKE